MSDEPTTVVPFKAAASPVKAQMLEMIDQIRAEIERDEVVDFIVLSWHGDRSWRDRGNWTMGALEMIGALMCSVTTLARRCGTE
jgi:hypothetical protein